MGVANGGAGGGGVSAPSGVPAGNKAVGGAGNPGGPGSNNDFASDIGSDGIGGTLWLVVGGDLTIGSGATIDVRGQGKQPTSGSSTGGGGASGGGNAMILHVGTLTNNGSITAAGGIGENWPSPAGIIDGGDGGKHTATISQGSQYQNMTLVSTATAAQAAPTKGDIVFTYSNAIGTAVINTNITAEISADNGSTWTLFSGLATEGTTGGHTIVSAHNQTITSTITAPYNMKYRIKTLVQSVSMQTRIHAVSLGWS